MLTASPPLKGRVSVVVRTSVPPHGTCPGPAVTAAAPEAAQAQRRRQQPGGGQPPPRRHFPESHSKCCARLVGQRRIFVSVPLDLPALTAAAAAEARTTSCRSSRRAAGVRTFPRRRRARSLMRQKSPSRPMLPASARSSVAVGNSRPLWPPWLQFRKLWSRNLEAKPRFAEDGRSERATTAPIALVIFHEPRPRPRPLASVRHSTFRQ